MKTLYLECNMGAAGDMLMAALLELIPDREAFVEEMNALGLPGVHVALEPAGPLRGHRFPCFGHCSRDGGGERRRSPCS